MRIWVACGFAIVLCVSIQAEAQQRLPLPLPRPGHAPHLVSAEPPVSSPMPASAMPAPAAPRPRGPLAEVTLADIGFVNGVRFANLGGHRELFVSLPQRSDVTVSDLVLVLDDLSAHEARRNLEVQVNDRTVAAIVLDGKSSGRVVRIALGNAVPKDGYLKISFLYS